MGGAGASIWRTNTNVALTNNSLSMLIAIQQNLWTSVEIAFLIILHGASILDSIPDI